MDVKTLKLNVTITTLTLISNAMCWSTEPAEQKLYTVQNTFALQFTVVCGSFNLCREGIEKNLKFI